MTYAELCELLAQAGYERAPLRPGYGEIWRGPPGTAVVTRTPAHLVGECPPDGYPRPEVTRVAFDGEDCGARGFHWASGGEGFAALREFLERNRPGKFRGARR